MRTARILSPPNAFLIVMAALTLFAFQDVRGLFETTEGRYAECSREMLETGDWLVPQLDYQPHWTKPPLIYWFTAASIKTFGRNEFSVRFPSALAVFLITLAVWKLGTVIWDPSTGYVAALLCCTSLLPVAVANWVSADALLALWETLVVLWYWMATRSASEVRRRRYVFLMWLCCGLAFLTKGPPGLLTLLCVLVYHWYEKRRGASVPRIAGVAGIATCIAVGISWYVAVVIRQHGLASYFLKDEVYARVLTDKFRRNPQWYGPFVVYIPALVLGSLPWLGAWGAMALRHGKRRGPAGLKAAIRDERILFTLIWLCLPLVILSISKSRLPFYVFPLFPAGALLLGRGIVGFLDQAKLFRRVATLGLVSGVVVIAVKCIAGVVPVASDMKPLYEACRRYDDGKTAFAICTGQEMFGLEFYMDRKLERGCGPGAQRGGAVGVHGLIDEASHSSKWARYVLITKTRDQAIGPQLTEAGLQYDRVKQSEKYELYIVSSGSKGDRGY
jgi:4-amino-4-deoxy-L-arabinose transferase-like glycosyltransferase